MGTMVERKILELGSTHHFLAGIMGAFQSENNLFYVMEFISGGDLLFHLDCLEKFSREMTVFYAAEMFLAINFLHENEVAHRDLKLDNIMLARDGHIIVTDFGLSKMHYSKGQMMKTFGGTPPYIAPEIWNLENGGD